MRLWPAIGLVVGLLPMPAAAQGYSDLTERCARMIANPDAIDYRDYRRFILVVMVEKLGDTRSRAAEASKQNGERIKAAQEAKDIPALQRALEERLKISCFFASAWHHLANFHRDETKKMDVSQRYRAVAEKVEQAAATFADGKTYETALPTIGIGEEYEFIRVLKCVNPMRGSAHHKGKIHDRWSCNRPGVPDDVVIMSPYYGVDDLPPT